MIQALKTATVSCDHCEIGEVIVVAPGKGFLPGKRALAMGIPDNATVKSYITFTSDNFDLKLIESCTPCDITFVWREEG